MKIKNSDKFRCASMTPADYRTGIIDLMCILEKHSAEFQTPEQVIALIHEYSELLTTLYHLDRPVDFSFFYDWDDTDDDEDEEDMDDDE